MKYRIRYTKGSWQYRLPLREGLIAVAGISSSEPCTALYATPLCSFFITETVLRNHQHADMWSASSSPRWKLPLSRVLQISGKVSVASGVSFIVDYDEYCNISISYCYLFFLSKWMRRKFSRSIVYYTLYWTLLSRKTIYAIIFVLQAHVLGTHLWHYLIHDQN